MFPSDQRGFSIVSALFLLVVLAGLGAVIATVSTTQQIGSALDVQGVQMYYAARAGTEWGLSKALSDPSSPSCENATIPAANFSYGVGDISVSVRCDEILPGEASGSKLYMITATACNFANSTAPFCPGNAANTNYVERRVKVLADTIAQ
mgnify:CR=1 FL=1